MKFALASLAALLISDPVLAGTPVTNTTPNILQPTGPWHVNNTEAECQLMREFGTPTKGLTLFLAQGAGPDKYDAVFAGTAIPRLAKQLQLEIRLMPQAQLQAVAGDSAEIPNHGGRFVRWFNGNSTILDSLLPSQLMTLSGNGRPIITLDLRGAKAAVAALRTCHDRLLQSWGINTEASKNLIRLPKPDIVQGGGNPGVVTMLLFRAPLGASKPELRRAALEQLPAIPRGTWVSREDYPSEAVLNEISGTATMVLSVNAAGRVENCRVVVSTKFEPLDQASCKALRERAKYTPALSASGEAVSSTVIERIRWEFP